MTEYARLWLDVHDAGWTGYRHAEYLASEACRIGAIALVIASALFGLGQLRSRFFRWGGWLFFPILLMVAAASAGAAMGFAVVDGALFCSNHPSAPSCDFDLGADHVDPPLEKTEVEWKASVSTVAAMSVSALAGLVTVVLGFFWLIALGVGRFLVGH